MPLLGTITVAGCARIAKKGLKLGMTAGDGCIDFTGEGGCSVGFHTHS